jgi:hypothetical protein
LLWLKHQGGIEHYLEDQHGERRHAECCHRRHLDRERQQDFQGMETHAGGHVDIEIGVVHAVKTPQRRHVMEDDVLTVDHEIERDHPERERRPGRQCQQIEQPPAVRSRDQGDADRSGRR